MRQRRLDLSTLAQRRECRLGFLFDATQAVRFCARAALLLSRGVRRLRQGRTGRASLLLGSGQVEGPLARIHGERGDAPLEARERAQALGSNHRGPARRDLGQPAAQLPAGVVDTGRECRELRLFALEQRAGPAELLAASGGALPALAVLALELAQAGQELGSRAGA